MISVNYLMLFYWEKPRPGEASLPSQAMLALIGYILLAWCGTYFTDIFRVNLILSLVDILLVSLGIHFLPDNLFGLATVYLVGIIINAAFYGQFTSSVALTVLSCLGFTLAFQSGLPSSRANQWLFLVNLALTALLMVIGSLQIERDLRIADLEKNESQKRLHHLEGLSRITKEIAGELELDKLLPLIIRKANQLTRTKAGGIVLCDNDGTYRIKAITGLSSSFLEREIIPGVDFLGKALLEKRICFDQASDYSGPMDLDHYHYAVAAPIHSKDDLIGLIFILSDTGGATFSKNDRLVLQTLGEQAAIAVINARRFKMTASLSFNDYLTGLGNIRFFYRELEHNLAVAARYRQSCSLMIVDSDSLKQINDCYGNAQGFRHIKELAAILKDTVRSSDLIARYDRDMFMIILPQTNLPEAIQLGTRIQQRVALSPLIIDGQTVNTSVSIGVAAFPADADNAQSLVSLVENLLHQAKQGGKNRLKSTLSTSENNNSACELNHALD